MDGEEILDGGVAIGVIVVGFVDVGVGHGYLGFGWFSKSFGRRSLLLLLVEGGGGG